MRDSLARHVPKASLSDGQMDALGARAWLDFGIGLLRPEELPDTLERRVVLALAEEKYGKRSALS